MANTVEIIVKSTDKTDFEAINRSAKRAGDGIGQTFKDIGKTAGGFLVAELTTKLAGFAADGLGWVFDGAGLASDIKESMNKVDAVFGSSADGIHAFAKDAAQSLGLSERAALDASGTFGNMFDQLGFTGQKSSDLSQSLVTLAADLGSFNNADITDVINAQTSAFRGEYDSLQRFIPTINAAAVEHEALAQTGKTSAKMLTDQEKALAVYTLMTEGAGKATGDFTKTIDSQANQEKIAAAETENLQAQIGEKLLPLTRKITEAKLALVKVLADKIVPALGDAGGAIRDKLMPAWQLWLDNKDSIIQGFRDAWDWTSNKLGPAISDLKKAATGLLEDVDWEYLKTTIGPLFGEAGRAAQDFGIMVVTAAQMSIQGLADGINWAHKFSQEHQEVGQILRTVWSGVTADLTVKMGALGATFRFTTALMKGDWKAAWAEMPSIAKAAIQGMFPVIGPILWNGLSDMIAKAKSILGGFATGGGSGGGGGGGGSWGSTASSVRKLSSTVGKRAAGGIASGLTQVAEMGAELIGLGNGGSILALPNGSMVHPASNTARMLGGGGGALIINVNVAGSVVTERDIRGIVNDALRNGGITTRSRG